MSDGGEVVALHPPSGDYDATRAFLLLHRPDGPWDLCAIHPDKPEDDLTKVLAARFHPDAEEELTSWLRAREAERYGVYFHLNPNTRPGRKARKQDVSSVEWFHVDVDVRADNDAFNFWQAPWNRPDEEYTSGVRLTVVARRSGDAKHLAGYCEVAWQRSTRQKKRIPFQRIC